MYRDQVQEFPAECREKDYERRLKDAYPIHPELFDRLLEQVAEILNSRGASPRYCKNLLVFLTLEILKDYVWKNSNHIDLKTLWKYLTNYLYLPRLKNEQVLLNAIASGVGNLLWKENFAYATGWDETKQRYLDLKVCEHITTTLSSQSLIVKPDIAQQQIDREEVQKEIQRSKTREIVCSTDVVTENKKAEYRIDPVPITDTPLTLIEKKRFYGSVELNAIRIIHDTSEIANEVLQHLTSLIGANVKITLEINVEVPEAVPDDIIRTVTENCHTLKFKNHSFEKD
jgi:hypothetical protein